MKSIYLIRAVFALATLLAFSLTVRAQAEKLSVSEAARTAVLKQHDKDADGKLNDAEREAMRRARSDQGFRMARSGRGRGEFPPLPPEIVKKYDKDGDGRLNEEERRTAMEGMQKQWMELQRKYDKNTNGRLDPEELETLQQDAAEGKIEDVPRMMFGPPRRRGSGPGGRPLANREELVRQMDKDRDGKLNEEELKAVRAELARRASERPQNDQPK
ncbi:MAG: hypothetical protein FJ403_21650 [Verrucomicrobia bacterium]|nr:hypothetical protein [Verrucomicrobiota bacterium]